MSHPMSGGKKAKAFAPASVANVGVGFDVLGFSAGVAGDTAIVEKIAEPQVVIGRMTGLDFKLPSDPALNTATAGLVQLIKDLSLDHGFKVSIEKGIPLGSGLGGSAASAVASIVAASALLEKPLTKIEMLKYALIGETVASGSRHADNVAPSLYGGFTAAVLAAQDEQNIVIEIPIPPDLWCVLLHPHIKVETKSARGILKKDVSLHDHIQQSAHLSILLAGLFGGDMRLLARGLRDVIVEPQRAHLIPGFREVQKSAVDGGAFGCTISGAGPSIFAWAKGQHAALEIQTRMKKTAAAFGPSSSWAFAMKKDGARLLS